MFCDETYTVNFEDGQEAGVSDDALEPAADADGDTEDTDEA
jgi:hypothetical protein